jgi:hypothetical protein
MFLENLEEPVSSNISFGGVSFSLYGVAEFAAAFGGFELFTLRAKMKRS